MVVVVAALKFACSVFESSVLDLPRPRSGSTLLGWRSFGGLTGLYPGGRFGEIRIHLHSTIVPCTMSEIHMLLSNNSAFVQSVFADVFVEMVWETTSQS